MPRPRRALVTDVPQHVIQRGNNKQAIFSEFQDYHLFLKFLREGADIGECRVHAYVLMTNHVHLLLTTMMERGIVELMQHIGRRYVRYYNTRHNRTGTLWEGRYKAALIKSGSYFLTCMRYVELNPVRAGMVRHPRDYRWSSYRANAGEIADSLITPHAIYEDLSPDPFARGKRYAESVALGVADAELHILRTATNRCRAIEDEGRERGQNKVPDT